MSRGEPGPTVVYRAAWNSATKPTSHCRNWKRYKGRREPKCNAGFGCYACWKKYFSENDPTDHVS